MRLVLVLLAVALAVGALLAFTALARCDDCYYRYYGHRLYRCPREVTSTIFTDWSEECYPCILPSTTPTSTITPITYVLVTPAIITTPTPITATPTVTPTVTPVATPTPTPTPVPTTGILVYYGLGSRWCDYARQVLTPDMFLNLGEWYSFDFNRFLSFEERQNIVLFCPTEDRLYKDTYVRYIYSGRILSNGTFRYFHWGNIIANDGWVGERVWLGFGGLYDCTADGAVGAGVNDFSFLRDGDSIYFITGGSSQTCTATGIEFKLRLDVCFSSEPGVCVAPPATPTPTPTPTLTPTPAAVVDCCERPAGGNKFYWIGGSYCYSVIPAFSVSDYDFPGLVVCFDVYNFRVPAWVGWLIGSFASLVIVLVVVNALDSLTA